MNLDAPDYECLRFEKRKYGIAVVTLDRPARLNALSGLLLDELAEVVERINADAEIRVFLIGGSPRPVRCWRDCPRLRFSNRCRGAQISDRHLTRGSPGRSKGLAPSERTASVHAYRPLAPTALGAQGAQRAYARPNRPPR